MSASVEKLKAARELVARPGGWTQGCWARTDDGKSADDDSDAVCWCALGAVWTATGLTGGSLVCGIEKLLVKVVNNISVSAWNDHPDRTQAEVVEAFDGAIALAEAEVC